jgi:hypothetical protein
MSYVGCSRCGGYIEPHEICGCSYSEGTARDAANRDARAIGADPFPDSCAGCGGSLMPGIRFCACGWREDGLGVLSGTTAQRMLDRRRCPADPAVAQLVLEGRTLDPRVALHVLESRRVA